MIWWILIGIGIGLILEGGGLGNPKKLTGVFTLTDWTVMKVLPTAIVASMAAVLVLTLVGVDTADFFTPRTQYLAQMIGGFLFGVGFFVGGYCPGTSIVALGTGRLDALPFAGGLLGGYYVWDGIKPHVRDWMTRASRDVDTLPELFGMDARLVAALFVAVGGAAIAWLFVKKEGAHWHAKG